MESNEIRNALREADRAEAAPWIEFPPTPWWYVPLAGFSAGAVVLALAYRNMVVFFLLAAAVIAFVKWYRRYRGMWPSGQAPREFRKPIAVAVTSMLTALALTALVHLAAGPWAAAATMALAEMGILTWYERAYADAARRTRERLA